MKILVYSYLLLLSFWSPKQGIEGYLREVKGNQMGVEKSGNSKGRPMFGKIYLFKDLNREDLVELDGQWCKSVQQKPYLMIQTDNKGYFKKALKAGQYIVLVEAYDGFFIPFFDQYNQPGKIIVRSKKYTPLDILVNSKAIY